MAQGIHPRADEKQTLLSVMNALRGITAPLVMEFIAHYERIVSNVLASSDSLRRVRVASDSYDYPQISFVIHHNMLKQHVGAVGAVFAR